MSTSGDHEFGCPDCEDVSRVASRARISRRQVVQGAAAAGAAMGLGIGAAGAQDASPEASPAGVQVDPTLTEPKATLPIVTEPATLRVLIPSNPTVEDFATNEMTAWFEEFTGVHIEWEVVPAATPAERDAALNLRLASGDYPDILMNFYPTPTVTQIYGQQGVFQKLNDLIDQHGVFTNRAFEAYPSAKTAATASDGNIYALPQVNDCFHCSMSQKLWINQEFLGTLGLEKPTTTDDYAEVLRQIKTGDPNGNGEADELPLSGSSLIWHGYLDEYFMNSFIYHPGNKLRLIVQDGQVTPIYAQDAWKEGIKFLAGLYAEGLVDPELFTRDRDQLRQIGDGGGENTARIGSVPAGWFGEFTSYDPDGVGLWAQYKTQPPLEGPGGVRFAGFNPYASSSNGAFIITDKCENPELAFKWADALGHIEATTRSIHGVKDRDWAWANEGDLGINGKQAIWKSITDIANVPLQNAHWSQAGPSFRSNDYRLGQYVPAEAAEYDIEVILYNATNEDYLPYKQPDEMSLPPLYFSQDQAQFVAEVTPTIEALVDEIFARAVTGQIDIEAEWENYLGQLEGMGLSQFIASHQEVYDAAKSAIRANSIA